ncbi:ABC transporter substrate-binding protein [Fictibacillus terranigra]|uniref:ABC transporter substrate-binding protein n=1 Tax=Fictibacillus terranigra TaxID=3058424 RepID=A0ABT8EBS0_9BACL|nr:ABC transporter substrate-binding protein [Fictibacillus sp. CENA-BCM004]MDN4075363.1 ABC transporter substrate-binding protein [Fictibacillus sp. CENA-BCM004]
MKNKRRLSWIIVVALLSAIMLTGCSYSKPSSGTSNSSSSKESSSKKDEIKVGLDVDAGTMDPRLSSDTSSKRVSELAYDGLIRLSDNLEAEPSLATKWDNPNPTTWIFTLRKNVNFQDGTPFTAEDVKYTFDTLLDPNLKAPSAILYEPIKSVDVVNKYQVKFTLKQPYAALLSYLDIGIVPKHIGEKNDKSLANHPIGTGPYKLVKWSKNNKIAFEANPKYWGGAPKTKKITYYIIPDNTTRVASLESGDVDLVHSPVSPQDISRIKQNDKLKVVETQGLGFTYLNFNVKNKILSEVKIRQALSNLVNKDVISSKIYKGMDKPGKSPLIPASWAYTDNVPTFDYDVKRAKALFKEAGWQDSDGDGVLDQNGKKLKFTLSTHSEDPNRVQTVEYLQNEFTKAGIETKVTTNEWPTFSASLTEGKFDIALVGWLNLVDPDRAMYNQFHTDGGGNYGKYSNRQVDVLLEKGRTALSQAERIKVYQKAASIVTEEAPYDVLLYQGYIAMYNKNLIGFKPYPSGSFYRLKDAEIAE